MTGPVRPIRGAFSGIKREIVRDYVELCLMLYLPNQKASMKVIIAGSRTFENYKLLKYKCDKILSGHKVEAIICGEAPGTDMLGKRYGKERGIPVVSRPADWDKYGSSAGYRRNEDMAKESTHLIVFWTVGVGALDTW